MNRIAFALTLLASGCAITSRDAPPADLGASTTLEDLEATLSEPGPIVVERVVAADWSVPLEGLVDLEHPRARAAGLEDRPEPIQIYFYVLRHPERGTFLVDSGVQEALRTGQPSVVSGLVASQMNLEALTVHADTAAWLAGEMAPPSGVFMTHLHLDHVLGLPDLPPGTPVYVGPGEAEATELLNLFVQGTTDRALAGKAFRSLAFGGGAVLDLFGDRSLYALRVPGHTPGSLAFVARTPSGPVLIAGDTCHTAWGWQHDVTPGTFTADREGNAASLTLLRGLAARHPDMTVHLGHQPAPPRISEARGAAARKSD